PPKTARPAKANAKPRRRAGGFGNRLHPRPPPPARSASPTVTSACTRGASCLAPPFHMIRATGQSTLAVLAELGDLARFTARGFYAAVGSRRLGRRLVRAVYEQGVRCVPVVLIVGLFTGLVLGLQGYYTLAKFGSTGLLGQLVALTLSRELAPVLAALMIVGQAGSALTAELGIQRNSEQIDALETMGIDPYGYLVAPRLIAALLVYPIMTVFFTLIGLYGGYLSASVL